MSVNGLGSVEEETEILIGKEDKGTPKGRKDYEREALAAKAKFLDLINDTDGWTEIKSVRSTLFLGFSTSYYFLRLFSDFSEFFVLHKLQIRTVYN